MAVGVGGVLDDRQLGGVAQDLIEHVKAVTIGRDDDLGPVGGVLVRDVGVGGDALVEEVARQDPGGQRAPSHGQAEAVRGRQCPPAPDAGEGLMVVLIDHRGVGRLQPGLVAQVPLDVPVQGVGADPGELGHAGGAEVAGLGQQRGVEVAAVLQLRGPGGAPAGVGQPVAETGDAVHLDDGLGQGHHGEAGQDGGLGGRDLGADHLGGQGLELQCSGVVEAHRPVPVGQERLQCP
jgi:hypothetical protein